MKISYFEASDRKVHCTLTPPVLDRLLLLLNHRHQSILTLI